MYVTKGLVWWAPPSHMIWANIKLCTFRSKWGLNTALVLRWTTIFIDLTCSHFSTFTGVRVSGRRCYQHGESVSCTIEWIQNRLQSSDSYYSQQWLVICTWNYMCIAHRNMKEGGKQTNKTHMIQTRHITHRQDICIYITYELDTHFTKNFACK